MQEEDAAYGEANENLHEQVNAVVNRAKQQEQIEVEQKWAARRYHKIALKTRLPIS